MPRSERREPTAECRDPNAESAIFDLDGTLLDGDSTSYWLCALLLRSPLRLLLALLLAPIALPLVRVPALRRGGSSMLLFVATFAMSGDDLLRVADEFAGRVRRGEFRPRWRQAGVAALERHLALGHRVAVVTASPALLTEALLAPWRPRVIVVGSPLKRVAGGWVGGRHCRGQEKCRALGDAGFGAAWTYAYSDSRDDYPMLASATKAFLVNGGSRAAARLRAAGLARLETLSW